MELVCESFESGFLGEPSAISPCQFGQMYAFFGIEREKPIDSVGQRDGIWVGDELAMDTPNERRGTNLRCRNHRSGCTKSFKCVYWKSAGQGGKHNE